MNKKLNKYHVLPSVLRIGLLIPKWGPTNINVV